MKWRFLFEPADFWVGAFIDCKKRRLYLLPIPCCGIVIEWPEPAKTVAAPQKHPHTLILAYNYAQAREWAQRNLPFHTDWRYCSSVEHLYGHSNVRVVKLPGWEQGKNQYYRDVVARLEDR